MLLVRLDNKQQNNHTNSHKQNQTHTTKPSGWKEGKLSQVGNDLAAVKPQSQSVPQNGFNVLHDMVLEFYPLPREAPADQTLEIER